MKSVFLSMSALALLTACATPPGQIAATSVSPVLYRGLTCSQLNTEALRVNAELETAVGVQERNANNDAAMTAVSLILFWPAMFMVGHGEDQAGSIAQLRGEAAAISEAAVDRGCSA